ncbi:MAG: Gfo/Idh/MocA family protein [Longimicrobiales bacterium]
MSESASASIPAELRLGVVGFGKVVRDYYLPAFTMLAGARIVAVADPLPESRRAATARLRGVAAYPDHRAMLDHAGIDAVLVASPPSTHLEVWSDAAAKGVPAFVEKPLVLSSQLERLSFTNEPRIMIDFNRRFWPAYGRVRDLVRRGVLGTPVELEFVFHLDVLRWSQVTRHRLDLNEGGLLHDLGCHAIDLAFDIIGEEPDSIAAVRSSAQSTEERYTLRLEFPSGSSATCDLAYGRRTRERLVARGPKRKARLSDPNMALHVEPINAPRSPLVRWSLDAAALGYRACRRSQSIGRASIRGALAAFVDSLRNGSPFNPGYKEAIRNARWVAAAARSAACGGVIQKR